jgi:hypothetical protein
MKRIGELSESEASGVDAEPSESIEPLIQSTCHCEGKRMRRRGSDLPDLYVSCLRQFRDPLRLQALEKHREVWKGLHKLDQDRALFDRLRQLAVSQGILAAPDGEELDSHRKKPMQYWFMGAKVCQHAWYKLFGVGSQRFNRMLKAVRDGLLSPPIDLRFIEGHRRGVVATKRAEIYTFLHYLYDTVAEILPEEVDDDEATLVNDPAAVGDDPWAIVHVSMQDATGPLCEQKRFLPPGSIHDLWHQFMTQIGEKCGWRQFYEEYTENWKDIMPFRRSRQHAICSTCVKYKILIRNLAHDLLSRDRQTRVYFKHLDNQHADRKILWSWRSISRQKRNEILIEIDAVDQSKFAWPRHPFMKSKEFDGVPRPRLHVTGALVHGYFRMVFVSEADRKKDSNCTIQYLANILTRLVKQGVDLRQTHFRINFDNTSRENKNTKVFRFLCWLVASRRVGKLTVSCLRSGHTHELIDQWLGRICRWIWHYDKLETPTDFVVCINKFLTSTADGREAWGFCEKVDSVLDWDAWFSHMKVHIGNLGGPSAAHVFTFERREGRWSQHVDVCHAPASYIACVYMGRALVIATRPASYIACVYMGRALVIATRCTSAVWPFTYITLC